MNILLILLACLSAGFFASYLIGKRNFWELLGLSGLLGTGIFTYLVFILYHYLGTAISDRNVTATSLVIIIVFFIALVIKMKAAKKYKIEILSGLKNLHGANRSLVIVIFLIQIFVLFQNLVWPITDWDAQTLYDFRARVIVENKGGFAAPITENYYMDYPPFTSLLHVFAYISGISQAKIWYSLLFLSASVLFYALARKNVSKNKALLGVLIMTFSPRIFEHSQMAYTNLPYAIFIGFGLIYLGHWLETKNKSDLLIGSLLVGLSTWVRLTEPFWVIAIAVLILGVIKERNLKSIFWIVISGIIIIMLKLPWVSFANSFGQIRSIDGHVTATSVATVKQSGLWLLIERAFETAKYLWKNVFGDYLLHLVLVLISLWNILQSKSQRLQLWHHLILLMIVGMLWAGTLIFSLNYSFWDQIPDSAARMSMFLSIILPYLIIRSPLLSRQKIS
jgi:4-amino-4-deoxy-L-arabinose transferase-like glycosyltransferase